MITTKVLPREYRCVVKHGMAGIDEGVRHTRRNIHHNGAFHGEDAVREDEFHSSRIERTIQQTEWLARAKREEEGEQQKAV